MTIKRIHIIIFCFITGLSQSLPGQNPFEIKDRIRTDSAQILNGTPAEGIPSSGENTARENNRVLLSPENGKQVTDMAGDSQNPFEVDRNRSQGTGEKAKAEEPRPVQIKKKETAPETAAPPSLVEPPEKGGNFLFWVILFAFLILAVGLSLDRWFISKLFRGIFNYNLSNTLMREMTGFRFILLGILYLLFLVSASLFVFLIFRYYTGKGSATLLLYSFGFVGGMYLIRHLALHLFHLIFPSVGETLIFSYSIVSFNIVAGILLLIPVLLVGYSPEPIVTIALYTGIALLILLFLLRSFRGMLISFDYINNYPIHFFLYLCAFEIIPLMVVYKLLTDFV
jgi:hypothetical protein